MGYFFCNWFLCWTGFIIFLAYQYFISCFCAHTVQSFSFCCAYFPLRNRYFPFWFHSQIVPTHQRWLEFILKFFFLMDYTTLFCCAGCLNQLANLNLAVQWKISGMTWLDNLMWICINQLINCLKSPGMLHLWFVEICTFPFFRRDLDITIDTTIISIKEFQVV